MTAKKQRMSEFIDRRFAGAFDAVSKLSPREAEVLILYGRGFKNVEIAERLGLSLKTVETHNDRIREKLAIRKMDHLFVFASLWMCSQYVFGAG